MMCYIIRNRIQFIPLKKNRTPAITRSCDKTILLKTNKIPAIAHSCDKPIMRSIIPAHRHAPFYSRGAEFQRIGMRRSTHEEQNSGNRKCDKPFCSKTNKIPAHRHAPFYSRGAELTYIILLSRPPRPRPRLLRLHRELLCLVFRFPP